MIMPPDTEVYKGNIEVYAELLKFIRVILKFMQSYTEI